MINIAKILKGYPKGTKLYSPIFEECTLEEVTENDDIYVMFEPYSRATFNQYGQYYGNIGECTLFPSKDSRDWNTFNKEKVNDIPIETLFKYLVKEKDKAIKDYNSLSIEYKKLYNENKSLKKRAQAIRTDGSFVSQKNYETMANERNKAIEDRDLFLSRYLQLKDEIAKKTNKNNSITRIIKKIGKKSNE